MNSESNTEYYQALQRAFSTVWPRSIDQPTFLEKGHLRLQIFPCDDIRATLVQAFGFEVLRQWELQRRAFQYGCFPMVPWASCFGDATLTVGEEQYVPPINEPSHALHGMACYSSWGAVEHKTDTLKLRMPLDAPWPWQEEVLQTLTLEDGALILRLEIHTVSKILPTPTGWYLWPTK